MHTIAILGWTGLVGQTLYHQLLRNGVPPSTVNLFNSKNLQAARHGNFRTLYIACMPAAKWLANRNPAADKATLEGVLEVLATVNAEQVILLSTVDAVDSTAASQPYGAHRRMLEVAVSQRWPATSYILRLPALFGRGLKKNALYDLLHENNVAALCLDSTFQWYNLANLFQDINECIVKSWHVTQLVSPPIALRTIMERWFPHLLTAATAAQPVHYNLRTDTSQRPTGFWTTTEALLAEMGTWIAWERWRIQHCIAASNIGFTMTPDTEACLRHVGITALEVAPTRGTQFDNFAPVSMQSLLYGLPISNIFLNPSVFKRHIRKLAESAAQKGIRTFVFGCPKQRDLVAGTSWMEAIDLFQQLGDIVESHGITLCLEPNAAAYGCTWLTTIADTLRFIQAVNHPHIRLSLDTGNYCMEHDSFPLEHLADHMEWIGHLQVSAAHLGPVLSEQEIHTAQAMVAHLVANGYTGTISYEAREVPIGEYCKGLGQFMDVLEAVVYHHTASATYATSTS